jgi:hypothetical protein
MERSAEQQDDGRMQMMERELEYPSARPGAQIPAADEPLVGACLRCSAESVFSASQVSAAYRVWKIGSGQPGRAASEFLGGDGTTNQCGCGMEGEVVCTDRDRWEVQWRRSRFAARS